jgi:hypothetical protein
MYQESFDLYLNYQLINRVFVNHLTLYVSSDFGKYYYHSYFKKTKILICQGNNDSFNLNEGRQKILVGQTFLSGKAINSEIIIDDIAVSANIIIILISKKPKSLFVILTLAVKSKSAFGVNITPLLCLKKVKLRRLKQRLIGHKAAIFQPRLF